MKFPWRKNRCPHVKIIGVYGGEVKHAGGYRLRCADCWRYLEGDISLATHGIDFAGVFPLEPLQDRLIPHGEEPETETERFRDLAASLTRCTPATQQVEGLPPQTVENATREMTRQNLIITPIATMCSCDGPPHRYDPQWCTSPKPARPH